MNKQEAKKYILQELGRNRPQDEIVAELSRQLNAPPELVTKFVSQVAVQQQPYPASPPASTASPPHSATPRSQDIVKSETSPKHRANTSSEPAVLQPASGLPTTSSGVAEVQPTSTQEELEEMVFKALSKDRRHSDIVMEVCEQTGMSWDQAQRFVAQVATENRGRLVSRQNMVIIPLAAIALLAGLALIYASVSEGLELARMGGAYDVLNQVSEVEYIVREGLWGFLVGISLFLGGMYGLIRGLQSQFD